MTTMPRSNRHVQRAALGGMLGLVVLAMCAQGSARAQEQEADSIWNLDQRIYRNILYGLGFRDSSERAIEYRERSPLVVPPSRSLPPPQANASARNPAWPKDPDITRREIKKKAPVAGDPRDPIEKFGVVLLPSELSRSTPSPSRRPSTQTGGNVDDSYPPVPPSQLGYVGGAWSWVTSGFGMITPNEEVGTFTTEPPRTSLIAPPTGYQTPSTAQPYGFVKRPEYQKPAKTEDLVVGKPGQ